MQAAFSAPVVPLGGSPSRLRSRARGVTRHARRRHQSPVSIDLSAESMTAPPTREGGSVSASATPLSAPAAASKTAAPEWLLKYLLSRKAVVDEALERSLVAPSVHSRKIVDAMRYSLLAGGKRVRPVLAIAAYEMFAGARREGGEQVECDLAPVIPAALAVEMIHTMSLIHDDLPAMDNDDFRRGKPTNHKVYGEDIAILAGDALLAYAFEFVARNTKGVDPARIVEVISLLAGSVGADGLAGGQVMDVENEGNVDVSLDTLTWIHTHKTAVLLRVSCAVGAILGGARPEDVRNVSDFAVKTGLAFQIADDVLDVTASTEALGKTAGKDVATNKATYPRLLGLDASRTQAQRLIIEAKRSLQPYGDSANTLLALADFIINRSS